MYVHFNCREQIDVLLLRSQFVDSVYKARQYIFHRKCKVQGCKRIAHPAVIIRKFQLFGLNDRYTKKLRKSFYTRIKKHAIIGFPSYLFVNFALLIAFKMEEPDAMKLSFPFAETPGSLANFRHAYQLL